MLWGHEEEEDKSTYHALWFHAQYYQLFSHVGPGIYRDVIISMKQCVGLETWGHNLKYIKEYK